MIVGPVERREAYNSNRFLFFTLQVVVEEKMSVPNHELLVKAICDLHDEVFVKPDNVDQETWLNEMDPRRLAFLPTLIKALNGEDPGLWGWLRKNDQDGKFPCDIAVWIPERITVDVMTGTGGIWSVQSPITNPNWEVLPADKDGKDRKSTRLNSSHIQKSRMPSSA